MTVEDRLSISKGNSFAPIALQATINSGIAKALATVSLAKIGLTRC